MAAGGRFGHRCWPRRFQLRPVRWQPQRGAGTAGGVPTGMLNDAHAPRLRSSSGRSWEVEAQRAQAAAAAEAEGHGVRAPTSLAPQEDTSLAPNPPEARFGITASARGKFPGFANVLALPGLRPGQKLPVQLLQYC